MLFRSALRREIDCALDKGYRVLTLPIWTESPNAFASLGPPALAMHKAFRENYVTAPAFSISTGTYFEVRRR